MPLCISMYGSNVSFLFEIWNTFFPFCRFILATHELVLLMISFKLCFCVHVFFFCYLSSVTEQYFFCSNFWLFILTQLLFLCIKSIPYFSQLGFLAFELIFLVNTNNFILFISCYIFFSFLKEAHSSHYFVFYYYCCRHDSKMQ